jgi:hypothetical protein
MSESAKVLSGGYQPLKGEMTPYFSGFLMLQRIPAPIFGSQKSS